MTGIVSKLRNFNGKVHRDSQIGNDHFKLHGLWNLSNVVILNLEFAFKSILCFVRDINGADLLKKTVLHPIPLCAVFHTDLSKVEPQELQDGCDRSSVCFKPCKMKFTELMRLKVYKSFRLDAKGYRQRKVLILKNRILLHSFARIEAIINIMQCRNQDMIIVYQIDFKTAFLNGDLQEESHWHQGADLQVSQSPRASFINQAKYALRNLKEIWNGSLQTMGRYTESDRLKRNEELMRNPLTKLDLEEWLAPYMYRYTASRHNLVIRCMHCTRNQAKPTKSTLQAIKRVFLDILKMEMEMEIRSTSDIK
ncbi:retrovirus-related pol polyprotein from transposon TNT 1-94 [Tanacetum coccineum]|uniref:Retrovirus-related pol polyprotein from transposon TNT 1-94 n=1 Tax=Tanacetum coccineum TaxID=301880 RepID=A0ABQ4ZWV1_9ASTR